MTRDITLEDTTYFLFTTRSFSTGAPAQLAGTPVISAYEDNSVTQITAGVSLGVDHDTVTGLNLITVVATAANGFENGKTYHLVITTGTVGGVSVVGEVVAEFTIGSSAAAVDLANGTDGLGAIKTDTAAILVDTAEIGAAGAGLTAIDLPDQTMNITGNITGNLSGSVGSVTGAVGSVTGDIGGIAANGLTADAFNTDTRDLLGTMQMTTIATLASQTSFTLTAGSADNSAYVGATAVVTDSATNAQKAVGLISAYTGATKTVTLAADPGIFTMAAGDTIVIFPASKALPAAVPDTAGGLATEDASGHLAVDVIEVGGTAQTAGDLAALVTTVDTVVDGIQTDLDNGTDGLGAIKADTAASLADTNELQTDWADGGRLDLIIDELTTNVDAVETDTQNIQSRLPAALSGNGNMESNVAEISDDTSSATRLEALMDGIVVAQVNDAGATTTVFIADGFTEATDDHFNGRLITFISGALTGQQTDITDYTGATQTFTVTALTEAPANNDFFVVH